MAAESPNRRRAAVPNENLLPSPGDKRNRQPSPGKQTAALSRHRGFPLSPSRIANANAAAAGADGPAAPRGVAGFSLRGAGELMESSASANGEWVVTRVCFLARSSLDRQAFLGIFCLCIAWVLRC